MKTFYHKVVVLPSYYLFILMFYKIIIQNITPVNDRIIRGFLSLHIQSNLIRVKYTSGGGGTQVTRGIGDVPRNRVPFSPL